MNAKTAPKYSPAQMAFMNWMATNHPNLYDQMRPQAGMAGLFDNVSSMFQTVVNNASSALQTYVTGKEQLALIKLNIARAKAGQNPVNSLESAPMVMKQPSALASVPVWAWIALGGVALFLFTRKD